jgi:hypothetical protein
MSGVPKGTAFRWNGFEVEVETDINEFGQQDYRYRLPEWGDAWLPAMTLRPDEMVRWFEEREEDAVETVQPEGGGGGSPIGGDESDG